MTFNITQLYLEKLIIQNKKKYTFYYQIRKINKVAIICTKKNIQVCKIMDFYCKKESVPWHQKVLILILQFKKASGLYTFIYTDQEEKLSNKYELVYKQHKMAPVIKISKKVAGVFRQSIEKYEKIKLSLNFDITNVKQDQQFIQYYIKMNDKDSYKFLKDIYDFRFSFEQNQIDFQPLLYLHTTSNHTDQATCFIDNMYCLQSNAQSFELIQQQKVEFVRQVCIWNQVKEKNLQENMWWKYSILYGEKCIDDYKFQKLTECAQYIMESLDFSDKIIANIEQCQNKFFEDLENSLQKYTSQYSIQKLNRIPAILLNYRIMKGFLVKKSFISAVCDSFQHQSKNCKTFYNQQNKVHFSINILNWILFSASSVFVVISALIAINYFCRERTKREIRQQIQLHVTQYCKINDRKSNKDVELTASENIQLNIKNKLICLIKLTYNVEKGF